MKKKISYFLILLITTYSSFAISHFNINIQRGGVKNIVIAIVGFTGYQGIDIVSIITNNFNSCDGFKILDESKHPENISIDNTPNLNLWKVANADAVLIGEIKKKDGEIELVYRLWDTVMKKQLSGKSITITQNNWQRVAHIISDNIYKSFSGDNGHFDTKIAYIAETGPSTKKTRRLAIMDQDGNNHQYLTNGSKTILTPRFSPNGEKIVYMSYENNMAKLYTHNILSGEEKTVFALDGISSAPRFSPKGDSIIMAISKNGHTNIHTGSLKTSKIKQLTRYRAISTSPSYSPDSKHIVFTSNRGGIPQIYTMNVDGSNVKRISFDKGSYTAPSWSPRGDYIAFTKSYNGSFFIGVMRPDGTGERILAKGFMVEGANWSPNGRMIIFSRQEKIGARKLRSKNKIVSLDIVSGYERNINTPQEAIDPTWSPFLH
ncbi:Tol-Pal system protein TolB [Candidatus Xenohaliotis californiensis]|uniref:Tol-Pal system protein TolB n=1 Tax=Candidatus Xenohaliotis californiensis TaxID=84677 RepID=A0ABM9N8W8_9RICK|nr:Tol-Pal system protein TolB [Candidatus Xenohaliotis californiensis]